MKKSIKPFIRADIANGPGLSDTVQTNAKRAVRISIASACISLLAASGTIANVYLTHHKIVEASFSLVGVEKEVPTTEPAIFILHGIVTNTGTQPITVLTADAFAVSKGKPNLELAVLGERRSNFQEPFQIEPGKQANVDSYIHLHKSFLDEGLPSQHQSAQAGAMPMAKLQVQEDVVIYGADGRYRIAQSPPFAILVTNGKIVAGKKGTTSRQDSP